MIPLTPQDWPVVPTWHWYSEPCALPLEESNLNAARLVNLKELGNIDEDGWRAACHNLLAVPHTRVEGRKAFATAGRLGFRMNARVETFRRPLGAILAGMIVAVSHGVRTWRPNQILM